MTEIYFNRLTFPSLAFYRWEKAAGLEPEVAAGLLVKEALGAELPVPLPRAWAIDNEGDIHLHGWGADLAAHRDFIRSRIAGGDIESRRIESQMLEGDLSFRIRCVPTIRRGGAEIDAWIAGRDKTAPRSKAYTTWLAQRLEGADITELAIAKAGSVEIRLPGQAPFNKPVALLEGQLSVFDPISFLSCLKDGIGRHGTLGFGAPLLARA